MPKIAGYLLKQHIDRGDSWLNAVDPWTMGPFAMHRQCAWENDGLRMIGHGELEIVSKIPLKEADKHTCTGCNKKLSTPVYFSFQEEYKRLHETLGWIRTIIHEEEVDISGNYQDIVDSTDIVCRDCMPVPEDGFYALERMNCTSYTCELCKMPMYLIGERPMREASNGACCIVQLFDFTKQYAPGYFVEVIDPGAKRHKAEYQLHELAEAVALHEALLKVSA